MELSDDYSNGRYGYSYFDCTAALGDSCAVHAHVEQPYGVLPEAFARLHCDVVGIVESHRNSANLLLTASALDQSR